MTLPQKRSADLSRSAISRYIQLATLFRSRIESGQWAAGSQIPTIDELVIECGVARETIRQAVGLLEAEGLVARFRAKGTFVRAQAEKHVRLDVTTDWSGLLNSRVGAVIEVLEDDLGGPPAVRPHDFGVVAVNYRRLKRRHSRDGQAFLLAEVYIDATLAKTIPEEAFTEKTALGLVSSIPGVRIKDAHQTVTIGTADIEVAELLDLPLNAPVCYVERSAVDQRGRLVLIAKGIYRGDIVRMDMKLK